MRRLLLIEFKRRVSNRLAERKTKLGSRYKGFSSINLLKKKTDWGGRDDRY